MATKRVVVCVVTVIFLLTQVGAAGAHGLIGKCFLPATLAIDDPFVADELSLPTVSHIKRPASGDAPATKETEIGAEFSKRLSPNLGITLEGNYKILDQEHDATLKGFDNLGVTAVAVGAMLLQLRRLLQRLKARSRRLFRVRRRSGTYGHPRAPVIRSVTLTASSSPTIANASS